MPLPQGAAGIRYKTKCYAKHRIVRRRSGRSKPNRCRAPCAMTHFGLTGRDGKQGGRRGKSAAFGLPSSGLLALGFEPVVWPRNAALFAIRHETRHYFPLLERSAVLRARGDNRDDRFRLDRQGRQAGRMQREVCGLPSAQVGALGRRLSHEMRRYSRSVTKCGAICCFPSTTPSFVQARVVGPEVRPWTPGAGSLLCAD